MKEPVGGALIQEAAPMLIDSAKGAIGGMDISMTAQLTWFTVNLITMMVPTTGIIPWQTNWLGNWGVSP